jgi:membrane protease YdiL (CAAX protease family)
LTGQFLLSTAVFEEVAFRGVLHAKLVRLVGVRKALLIGSGLFSAWHAVITWHNLRQSNLPRRLFAPLYGAAMVVLFGAGLIFGGLREGTGHLAGSILAHWLMVTTIVLSVARVRWRGE